MELPNGEGYIFLFMAVEHPSMPLAPPAVRAETIFAGQVSQILNPLI